MTIKKVGLLGSTKTIKTKLHHNKLSQHNIDVLTPTKEDQDFIDNCIIRIVNNEETKEDIEKMIEIVEKLTHQGADGIILGCTDLPKIFNNINVNVPIVNSLEILEDAAVLHLATMR